MNCSARCPCFITPFFLLTFVKFHAETFSNFSHSLSTGIFMAWGIGIYLVNQNTMLQWIFTFSTMWSSWLCRSEFPIRILVDSLAADDPVVHAVVFLLTAFLCKLIRRKVFCASLWFSTPVTTSSVLSDVEIPYGKSVDDGWDILSIHGKNLFRRPHTHAVYNACTAMVKTKLALPLRLRIDDLGNLNVSCIHDSTLRLVAECIEWLFFVEVVLNGFWLWVTCDSPNQVKNLKFWERFTASSGMPEMLKSMFPSSVARSNLSALSRFLR